MSDDEQARLAKAWIEANRRANREERIDQHIATLRAEWCRTPEAAEAFDALAADVRAMLLDPQESTEDVPAMGCTVTFT